MKTTYKLQGKHRHYDWGGKSFIPQMMHVNNVNQLPYAEYWMGAHPSAPSMVTSDFGEKPLDLLIKDNPTEWLGAKTKDNFGSLPYLFKVLDVEKMLSIQVHPSKVNAEIGFDIEETKGIAIDAPNRNYKDRNHKPEVMVALSDFWLLHGFLPPEELDTRLKDFFYFNPLLDHFRGVDYQGLYSFFMHLSIEDSDLILKPLMMDAVASVKNGSVDKTHPHWWANKYYNGIAPSSNIDKGIFSIYILNIVHVSKYQGVFQGAGLLHAYLEGQNIELMANSDNVLRGGLTTKHIDIEELLQHINFVPTYPALLEGDAISSHEIIYPCPVPDFGLTKIAILAGETYTINTASLTLLLVTEGQICINDLVFKMGEVAVILPTTATLIQAQLSTVLFKSYVP
ncbi:MAG: mannose-6-phosphate isomerase, class I [Sediminibacterium sp.]